MINLDEYILIDQEKINKIKKEKYQKLIKDQDISAFIKNNHIEEKIVYRDLGKIDYYYQKRCLHELCPGLDQCPLKGMKVILKYDEEKKQIDYQIIACKEYVQVMRLKNKFVICQTNPYYFSYRLKDCLMKLRLDRKELITTLSKMITKKELNSIYLYGNKGTGKTFIMSVFAKTLIEKFPDKTIGYLLFDEIVPELVNLSSSYSQAQKNEFNEDIHLYAHLDILLIDNFGDEEKNDFAKENIILKILKTRLELNLPTFIISSHQKQELYTLYNTPRNGRYLVKEILDILNTYQEINLPTFINLNDK